MSLYLMSVSGKEQNYLKAFLRVMARAGKTANDDSSTLIAAIVSIYAWPRFFDTIPLSVSVNEYISIESAMPDSPCKTISGTNAARS